MSSSQDTRSSQSIKEDEKMNEREKHLPSMFIFNILLAVAVVLMYTFCASVMYLVYHTDASLGHVASATDQKAGGFIVDNAKHHLEQLVSFGPRIVGSTVNEVDVPEFLKSTVERLSATFRASIRVEIDTHKVSGRFEHKFLNGFWSVYTNVTNFVVRISSMEMNEAVLDSQPAVLVNAHFDSFVTSPGASDDGVGVGVMLEVIRAIAFNRKALQYPIVFLFNGAEENNQQAAHGFITDHAWAKVNYF